MRLKIFIVDDEELIREGLASMDWDELDIEVAGLAENGEKAFEKIRATMPDIVITDIRMPKKDGIWLAQQIKAEQPNIKMIFLTGYNEFEYAQKAISLDVFEYVLKPIEEEVLIDIVKKLKLKIEKERISAYEMEKFKSSIEESRYFLKSWFVNTQSNTNTKFDFFGLSVTDSKYATISIGFENNAATEIENCSVFVLFKEIIKFMEDMNISPVPFYDGNLLTFVFQFVKTKPNPEVEKILFDLANEFKNFLDAKETDNYTIGIGFIADSIENINLACNSACNAIRYSYYLGQRQIIYIKDVEPQIDTTDFSLKANEDYINSIKIGDEENATKIITQLFESKKQLGISIDNMKRLCLELIVSTSRAIYEIGQDPKILFNQTDSWSVINKCTDENELYDLIIGINKVVISHVQEIRKNKNDSIVEKIKEIVDQNYADGVTLDSIAAQVYLSPCYLSVIFSKETNMNFKDYLIQTRINKAKELLMNTDLKIYSIAEKVGYSDTRYFSDLFRRYTGINPTQYRNKA